MRRMVFLPYDFDTALGTNNEGDLVFGYAYEDTDHLPSGADVFNGQQSVLWNNLRDTYGTEIAELYQSLRSQGKLSYSVIEGAMEDHQHKWPEAIFNEDAYFKYLSPLIDGIVDSEGNFIHTASYLPMLQGSKQEQRRWWLYNRFRYMDSKYNAGDAASDVIQLRGYAKADITVTPYADIYPTIKYGSYLVQTRGTRGQSYTLVNPLSEVNDTEIYIYSASLLSGIGDLSGLKVGFADFSAGSKLGSIIVGSAAEGYTNGNLKTLTIGSNKLLRLVDARNCTALATSIDLKGASNIEEAYFDGTAITGVELPNGGALKKLHLPATVSNLTIQNQTQLTEFVLPDAGSVTTLRVENTPAIDTLAMLDEIADGARVRLIGVSWTLDSADDLTALKARLDLMRGLDESGGNTPTAQVSGTISVPSVTSAELAAWAERYPYITIAAQRALLTIPTATSPVYNAEEQSPDWSNYYPAQMTMSGETAGTNAGEYTVTFTLRNSANTWWEDGTITPKEVTWTIAKASPRLTVTPDSLTLGALASGTATVSTVSTGAVTAESGNIGVAVVEWNEESEDESEDEED